MLQKTGKTKLTVLATSLLVAAGCGRSPQVSFYTLTPLAAEQSVGKSGVELSVAPVTLPELVDRPQLIMLEGNSRVQIMEQHRWGEPLKYAIPRLLAENLSRRLGSDKVSAWPQHASSRGDLRLFVDFQHFESAADLVRVDAIWELRSVSGQKLMLTGRSKQIEKLTGSEYQAVIDGYNLALAKVAEDISAAILKGVP